MSLVTNDVGIFICFLGYSDFSFCEGPVQVLSISVSSSLIFLLIPEKCFTVLLVSLDERN